MDKREQIIRTWFEMWGKKDSAQISSVFNKNVYYSESWGPEYHGIEEVKHWFEEWNTRGQVVLWDIKRFIHSGNTTVVEWHFKDQMNNGISEVFDGISLIDWNNYDEIVSLKEFGSKLPHYNPYKNGENSPVLKNTQIWT